MIKSVIRAIIFSCQRFPFAVRSVPNIYVTEIPTKPVIRHDRIMAD